MFKRASPKKMYHKVELDALCQNNVVLNGSIFSNSCVISFEHNFCIVTQEIQENPFVYSWMGRGDKKKNCQQRTQHNDPDQRLNLVGLNLVSLIWSPLNVNHYCRVVPYHASFKHVKLCQIEVANMSHTSLNNK